MRIAKKGPLCSLTNDNEKIVTTLANDIVTYNTAHDKSNLPTQQRPRKTRQSSHAPYKINTKTASKTQSAEELLIFTSGAKIQNSYKIVEGVKYWHVWFRARWVYQNEQKIMHLHDVRSWFVLTLSFWTSLQSNQQVKFHYTAPTPTHFTSSTVC